MPTKESEVELDLEHAVSSSQADTEPLPFEDEEEIDQTANAQHKESTMSGPADEHTFGSVQTSPVDTSMNDTDTALAATSTSQDPSNAQYAGSAPFSDALTGLEDEDEDAEGEDDVDADADADGSDDEEALLAANVDDEIGAANSTANGDDTGEAHSPAAGAAGFSDGSELTDEDEEDDDAVADGEEEEDDDDDDDDDEMGGGSDDDEEDNDEDEDEDAEGEDEDEDGDEDEAAKALAALTASANPPEDAAGTPSSDTDNEATSIQAANGLDGLAVLAAAGANDSDQLQGDSDAESAASSRSAVVKAKSGRLTAKPRLGSRLNEVMLASEPSADEDAEGEDDVEDEDEEHAEEGDEEDQKGSIAGVEGEDALDGAEEEVEDDGDVSRPSTAPKERSRQMSSLGQLATAAKKTATRSGPAAGLLAGAPSITIEETASGAASLASTPAGSPKPDEDEDEDEEGGLRRRRVKEQGEDLEGEKGDDEEEEEEEEEKEKDVETPAQELEEAVAEEEPSTDEAAVKRQEAMESLTKIEIGFAVLRDKLYVERMDEISKEGEMILEGTHPDLIYLTNFIEARRERRLKLVEMWFDQQQKQYERVAHAEEAAAWSNWRNEVVELRQRQLDDISRKRRKLDREKRSLDGPRPARRHQIFETELVRNPYYDAAKAAHVASASTSTQVNGASKKNKKKPTPRQQELEDLEEMGAYVAYPDLRSADDQEAWMDMESMGVQPDVRLMPGGMGYYRIDEMGMDPYAMYAEGVAHMPPGAPGELLPPYGAGGPPPMHNNMILDRPDMDGRDRGPPPQLGPPPPSMQGYMDGFVPGTGGPPGYGGPPVHLSQRGRGAVPHEHMFIDDRVNMSQHQPPHMYPQPIPSRKRAGSPSGAGAGGSGGARSSGKSMEERGRKGEGQQKRSHASSGRHSPPSMGSGAARKGGSQTAARGQNRNRAAGGPGGMDAQRSFVVGGPPPPPMHPVTGRPVMHEDGFYEGPPPPHPGASNGASYGPSPIMGSPRQPHHGLASQAPPPPMNMGRPMHGPGPGPGIPAGYPPAPGRRLPEPMYQR